MELRICQSLYNRQSEITRAVVEGLSNTHVRTLNEFKFVFIYFFTICFLKELLLFIFNACGSLPCWICFPAIYLYRPTICGASVTLWMLRLATLLNATNMLRSCKNSWPGLCSLISIFRRGRRRIASFV